jgi:hypothetical protein
MALVTADPVLAWGDQPTADGTGGPGANSTTSAITSWVETHYHSETVGGHTVYVLSPAAGQ